jgi:hypothetical protein
MNIHIRHGDLHLTELRTRMPFKYGIAVMNSTPHAFVRVAVEVDGKLSTGIAADSLPPKWFTKDAARPLDEEVAEMVEVIQHALQHATDLRADSPFDAWLMLYQVQAAWGRERRLPPLLSNFGAALVERALVDAVCKGVEQPLASVLRANALGFRLGELYPSLLGKVPADFLPERPLRRITIRQTVGLADPLGDDDIPEEERVRDGLPQSLDACIRFYGLRHFKIKVSGEIERDRARLVRIAKILDAAAGPEYAFTLDGNEQFHTMAAFREFWETLLRRPDLGKFFQHLLFVEQPFHRDAALRSEIVGHLASWAECPAMIIDESDGELESLPRALALGYAGVSHKNCKGLFKGIINYCLLKQWQREQPDRPALVSGEDLVNVGPVALLQDLAACAALGLESVERNGHHYFKGLSMFPAQLQAQILRAHPDLYRATAAGWPSLDIRSGEIALGSVNAAPFGVGFEPDVTQFNRNKELLK